MGEDDDDDAELPSVLLSRDETAKQTAAGACQ